MQFLITERQKREINKYLALFFSLDEEAESLFSHICEERNKEINLLRQNTTPCEENKLSESIFVQILRLIHPENLADMLLAESPIVRKIILNSIPRGLSEVIQFYLPPEVISNINAIPFFDNIDCAHSILAGFAKPIVQNLTKCLNIASRSNNNILTKLITMSYDEVLSVLKSAGELALTTSNRREDFVPGRNEMVFAGYTLLAALIAEQADGLKEIILDKFPQEVQKILNSLLSEKKEEIKWIKQKSEEILKMALEMS